MTWPLALPFLLLTLLGVGFFAVKGWKSAKRLAALKPSADEMEAALDNPELDEGFARDMAARARHKGAV